MGKYDKYVLMSDMDGTLLHSSGKVSPENLVALKRFTEGGGHFAIATGRPMRDALDYVKEIDTNTACVFLNGAILYDCKADRVVKTIPLEGQLWRDFAQMLLREYPQISTQVYTEDNCHIISSRASTEEYLTRISYSYEFSSYEDVKDMDWLKLMLLAEPELIREMLVKAEKMGICQACNGFFTDYDCYEFVNKSASKGHMLQELRKLPENQGRKFVAMGDYGNDTYMLQVADVGVASGNAHEDTKAAADIVGVNCNDHLAAYVIGLIDEGKI